VVSWWGPNPIPDGHILDDSEGHELNSVVCCPDQEDTMITTLHCTGWIKLLLRKAHPKVVADVYSTSGKLSSYTTEWGVDGY